MTTPPKQKARPTILLRETSRTVGRAFMRSVDRVVAYSASAASALRGLRAAGAAP
ncbi:hypothetical protein QE385_002404 [Sphingomonas sp. SORGH_AS 950]|uniref:hypothetical protein n=1 Tax=Sphingomonas sp. SORGH_AS_0950 TaxID=3041792 RepID=UPI00278B2632|nr:hypothetical protein [Sphingomonas sp. SORGH_AS_0950]MDQ1158077.1 hypothetical protein [Sphingomonas sp. SORGH_AS_0950]